MTSIRQLPGEPIVIVTLTLPVHEYMEEIGNLNAQIAEIARHTPGCLYRISDASHLDDISFSDILLWLMIQLEKQAGSIIDPRIKPIAVGQGIMSEAAIRKVKERFGLEIPMFPTLDQAIQFARNEIALSEQPCVTD